MKIQLRHASDGEMLFVLINQAIPDIIYFDIDVPCRDGINCIVEIRKNKDLNKVPVIMFTEHEFKHYIKKAYENGANFYLLKTANIEQLTNYLKQVFSIEWRKSMYYPTFDQFVLRAL
jgi:DNA-binding NarL/FixJ family response regulator